MRSRSLYKAHLLRLAAHCNPPEPRDRRSRLILDAVRQTAGHILHVGCCDPGCAMDSPDWLHGHIVRAAGGKDVVGADVHIDRMKEMRAAGYTVFLMRTAELLYPATFSLIIAGEVVEHVPNQMQFWSILKRVLKPGGRIILTTPSPWGATHAFWFWLSGGCEHHGGEHVLWHSPATLRILCAKFGMNVVKVHYCSYGLDRRRWWALPLGLLELIPWCRQTVVYEIEVSI